MSDADPAERSNRLLALWIHLQETVRKNRQSGARIVPWDRTDKEIAALWQQITQPQNQLALEEWLFQVTPGELELWAQHAVVECRRRCKQTGN